MRKSPPESAEYPHGNPSGSAASTHATSNVTDTEREDNSHKVELIQEEDNEESASEQHIEPPSTVAIQLADFVGDHGAYQLSLSALLFLRYVLLGLMANSGPLMTPDVTFYCHLPRDEIVSLMPNISLMSASEQELEIKEEFKQICQLDLHLYKNVSLLARNATTKSQAKTTPLIITAGAPLQAASTTGSATSAAAAASAGNESRIRECTDFTYQLTQDQGLTMTSEFDLVCDNDWLRSLFQSLISASIVVAHVFWGTFSDKFGRFQAQRICLVVSLAAGLLSIFALDFWTFTLTRALCSFGDLGMVVSMTTTVVELVGSKYRGLSVAAVNFGYALGVSLLPYVVAYFENFRLVVAFTVLCHMLTMPFILATGESIRWLLSNRKFKQARRELKRIARWNRLWTSEGKVKFESNYKEFISQLETQQFDAQVEVTLTAPPEPEVSTQPPADEQRPSSDSRSSAPEPEPEVRHLDELTQARLVCQSWRRELLPSDSLSVPVVAVVVEQQTASSRNSSICDEDELRVATRLKQQPDCINLVAHQLSFVGRVSRLFKDKQLMIAVFTIVWTTFNSELLYTSFIIINLEVGEDVYLNYILGGCMEALAAIMASLLLSYAPRRLSLIAFWLLISMSCFGLSLAHIDSTWAVWMLALAKFAQSSLSSIASVAAYEAFPTFLRQSGSGLVFTLGMLGSVFAPLIFAEFDDHAGMDNVLLTFSFSSLTAATLIYLFLTETRNCELM